MLNRLNFIPYECTAHYNAYIHLNSPEHCSTVVKKMWDITCLECLSFRLHHVPCSISQHVPDISLLLKTRVSWTDLHTAPTTQTPSGITSPRTSSIFHSRMKYVWMCARHLPSLGLCSPQEARLICNWEVCWINQQFIHFLIETTISKKQRTAPLILSLLLFAYCHCSQMARWDSGRNYNGDGNHKELLKRETSLLCRPNTVWVLHGEFIWCSDLDFRLIFCCFWEDFVDFSSSG